jgi:hypothetical protein
MFEWEAATNTTIWSPELLELYGLTPPFRSRTASR